MPELLDLINNPGPVRTALTGFAVSLINQATIDHEKVVTYNISPTPTRAELIGAFKLLPDYDWAKSREFGIIDTDGSPLLYVYYHALPTSVDEATAGGFWREVLTEAV